MQYSSDRRTRASLLPLFLFALLISAAAAAQPLQWISKGPGGGGAMFSPSFNPNNPAEMYVASDLAALFRTRDVGSSWSVVDFRQIQANRWCNIQFTSDPAILYCLNFKQDARIPYKSADGGSSWNRLPSDPTNGEAFSLFADPANPRRLVTSDFTRVFFSNDGGSSFSLKYQTIDQDAGIHLAGAFFDGDNIFVGTSKGLLVSPNGGVNFFLADNGGIPGGEAIFSLAGAKQNGIVRLYAVTLAAPSVYAGVLIEGEYTSYRGTYSLDWGQLNWISRSSGIAANHFPSFAATASSNISTVYLAGGDDREFPVIYKSTNGGAAWQSVLLTTNNQNIFTGWAGSGGDRDWSYGGAALGLAVVPNNPDRIAFTDLGFVHLSTDGGANWKQAYLESADQNPKGSTTPKGKTYRGNGMENTSAWWLTWSDPLNLFASFTDIRGVRSTDGGNSWSFQYSGHTLNTMYQAIKHPVTGVLYAATSSVHDIYQSTYLTDARIDGARNRAGRVLFSSDRGAAWQLLHDFGYPVIWVSTDPTRPNRLYASVIHNSEGGIYVSNDIQNGSSSNWTKLSNPPRTEGHPFNIVVLNDGTIVVTYSGRRAGNPLNFTASSGVFVSNDDGFTWSDRSAPGMFYWTKDITVDPHDPGQNTWYVSVFSGFGGASNGLGGLYKTSSRGLFWSRLVASDRVESCTINPKDANEMYLTTEQEGLWYCGNLTSNFPAFNEVTNYPFLHPVRVFYSPTNNNEIWVTSFGNGLRVSVQGQRFRRRP